MNRGELPTVGAIRGWVPRWWRGEGGGVGTALSAALWPAEQAYRATMAVRALAYDAVLPVGRAPSPVISVGNIAVGGAGKTPVAAWLAARLAARGLRPAIVLRGYGTDEILVHREINPEIPVFAAVKRIDGALEAAAAGCNVVVLDDGFQHLRLHRDLDIVLVAAESWSPRPRLLPRGPWREGIGGLERAGVLLVTRKTASAEEAARVVQSLGQLAPEAICVSARIYPDRLVNLQEAGESRSLASLQGETVLAVASLADPRPFKRHLEDAGATVELVEFPDHHNFSASEAADLERRAAGRTLIMTRKEAVKLRPLLSVGCEAMVLQQDVEIETGRTALLRAVRTAVARLA
ncbi:tetraacyldisaccharide 4'-kinase [soil metagenome]